jgi:tRNA modification GTPase
MFQDRDQDTICALSTPAGVGGIAVIRLSGPKAFSIARSLCQFLPESNSIQSHRAYYGMLQCFQSQETIDEVIATAFKKGHSFTGEDTCEVSCHGSPVIARQILEEMTRAGARAADRGEFTYRAFMNGRMDLIQAESVLSLIESQSRISTRQALRQLQGDLSKELEFIEDQLIWCLAHIEASIDFSTEGLEIIDSNILADKVAVLNQRIQHLVDSYQKGRIVKDGFQLVLTGIPNVGKSSLLNLLLEDEKAIVTDIPGTTRDLIEGSFLLGGFKVHVTDTAGLRLAQDQVERIGIERSYAAQKRADAFFFIFDSSTELSPEELKELSSLDPEKTILVGNKKDLVREEIESRRERVLIQIRSLQKLHGFSVFSKDKIHIVSSFDKRDGQLLKTLLQKNLEETSFEDHAVVSQIRHFENLQTALSCLQEALPLVKASVSPELIALSMKEALLKIQETLGKRFDDQIMDRVFKEFCIGK